jgi:hypothetical protein
MIYILEVIILIVLATHQEGSQMDILRKAYTLETLILVLIVIAVILVLAKDTWN